MRKSVLALVGVAVVIVIVGFMISHRSGPNPSHGPSNSTNNPVPIARHDNKKPAPPQFPAVTTNTPPTFPRTHQVQLPPANQNLITNWEERLDTILTAQEKPDSDKAKELIAMFPNLSPEAQEEIAHHISNLTPDENYAPLGQFLTNSALPEAVLDVFTEDVLNRPNSIKLPLLLDLARDPNHPKASEAKDILELFLEEDYGNDWTRWQAKLDQWLKDNPD